MMTFINRLFKKHHEAGHLFLLVTVLLLSILQLALVARLPIYQFILLSMLVIILAWVLYYLLSSAIGSKIKAAIIIDVILLPLLGYKCMLNLSVSFLSNYQKVNTIMFIIIGIIWVSVIPYLLISQRKFHRTNICLNIFAIIMVIFTVYNVTVRVHDFNYLISLEESKKSVTAGMWKKTGREVTSPGYFPDIYYIIFDAHTSFDSLRKYWGYNDSFLADHLKNKGFYIASKSRSNYKWTTVSLASSLNMKYLEEPDKIKNMEADIQFYYGRQLVKNSLVENIIESAGYDIINLSFFSIRNNDSYYHSAYLWPEINSIGSIFYEHTILFAIMRKLNYYHECSELWGINFEIISKLKEIPTLPKRNPVFVYAHIMMPHFPYMYDAHGNMTPRVYWAPGGESEKKRYLDQLIFTDRILSEIIDAILLNSRKPPIIIVQGDHGFRNLRGKEQIEEQNTILNAYYLPGEGSTALYASISPVNTFRLIFNHYFKTAYKLLEDQVVNIN